MDKELIIKMAREAGGLPDPMVFIGAYERFAALVAAAERETFYGQDRPDACRNGCPIGQICDYCQIVAPVQKMIAKAVAAERESWPAEMEAMERQVNILTDALAQAKAEEREACAKVCEDLDAWNFDDPGSTAAAAIREALAEQPAQQQEPSEYVQKVIDALYENSDPTSIDAAELLEQMGKQQEPVAWMDGYRNIYSLEEKAAGCKDAVIPLVPATLQHWSDCAVHNEPAYPAGKCDCGGYTSPQPAQQRLELIGHADLTIMNIHVFSEYGDTEIPKGRVPLYAGYKK